jgi:mono/diheme cytochrome c family protein
VTRRALIASLVTLSGLVGCNDLLLDPMQQQPKFKAYSANPMYSDGRAMREPVEGTFPREKANSDPALAGGDVDAGVFIERIPLAVDRALLERGRERFDISCAPCHGTIGDGSSVIAQKMSLRPPPSLLGDSVRAAADGKLEEVVRVGWGTMAGYESQLTSRDRWAVVAYVRALQLSQRAPLDLAPADERQRLAAEPAP